MVRHGRFGQARWVVSAYLWDVSGGGSSRDADETVTLWVPPKSPVMEVAMPDGRLVREIPRLEALTLDTGQVGVVQPGEWYGPGVVMQTTASEPWSVWWFFREDGDFDGWYGNLEAPSVRWTAPDGTRVIDTADRELDLVFGAEGSWWWKDEDAFAATTGRPGFWADDLASVIRADGERLRGMFERREGPFDGRHTDFLHTATSGAGAGAGAGAGGFAPLTMSPHWDAPHSVGP